MSTDPAIADLRTALADPSRVRQPSPADPRKPALHSVRKNEAVTTKPNCWRCETTPAAGTCCSSHKKDLCHLCYRRTHFVEVCVAGCTECATEGLPVKLSDLKSVTR